MKWPMDQIEAPTPPPKSALGTQSTQAPCVEPQIIFQLEGSLERAASEWHPLWLALLASLLQTTGCLRLAHIKRSFPVREHNEWVEFVCCKCRKTHCLF